jgi:hypothetical protein
MSVAQNSDAESCMRMYPLQREREGEEEGGESGREGERERERERGRGGCMRGL